MIKDSMPINPSEQDARILARCYEGARLRTLIELGVVRHLLWEVVIKHGLRVVAYDGTWDRSVQPSGNIDEAVETIFALDVSTLRVSRPDGSFVGVVKIILGNDGWDCIADNTILLDDIIQETTEYAERLSEIF